MLATANEVIPTRMTGSSGDDTAPPSSVSTYTKHQKAQLAATASFPMKSTMSAICGRTRTDRERTRVQGRRKTSAGALEQAGLSISARRRGAAWLGGAGRGGGLRAPR